MMTGTDSATAAPEQTRRPIDLKKVWCRSPSATIAFIAGAILIFGGIPLLACGTGRVYDEEYPMGHQVITDPVLAGSGIAAMFLGLIILGYSYNWRYMCTGRTETQPLLRNQV